MKMDSDFRLIHESIQQMLISFSEIKLEATCVTIQQIELNRGFGRKVIPLKGKSVGDGNRNQVY